LIICFHEKAFCGGFYCGIVFAEKIQPYTVTAKTLSNKTIAASGAEHVCEEGSNIKNNIKRLYHKNINKSTFFEIYI